MQIEIRSSFARDAKKLSTNIQQSIANAIALMANAKIFSAIPNIKGVKGGKKAKNAYRMRINDYRICFYLIDENY